jgi:hypothetical protein
VPLISVDPGMELITSRLLRHRLRVKEGMKNTPRGNPKEAVSATKAKVDFYRRTIQK